MIKTISDVVLLFKNTIASVNHYYPPSLHSTGCEFKNVPCYPHTKLPSIFAHHLAVNKSKINQVFQMGISEIVTLRISLNNALWTTYRTIYLFTLKMCSEVTMYKMSEKGAFDLNLFKTIQLFPPSLAIIIINNYDKIPGLYTYNINLSPP